MKTKILGIVTIVTIVLMMLVSSVNAAELAADKQEMQKGDIVTITISTSEKVESMQFDLKFDATKYKYVENSAKSELETIMSNANGDVVTVSAYSVTKTAKTVTLQFEAIENGEQVPFTISNTEFTKAGEIIEEGFSNPTISVTVADKEEPTDPEEPIEPEEPTDPEEPGDNVDPTNPEDPSEEENQNGSKDENNSGEYVDENGNVITKLPQTGSLVPAVATGIVILALAGIAIFKVIKK